MYTECTGHLVILFYALVQLHCHNCDNVRVKGELSFGYFESGNTYVILFSHKIQYTRVAFYISGFGKPSVAICQVTALS